MVYLYYNVKSQACCVLSSSSLTDTLREGMSVNINELSLRQPAGWACLQSNKVIREGRLLSLFQVLYLHSTSMMNKKKLQRQREKVNCSAFQVFLFTLSCWALMNISKKWKRHREKAIDQPFRLFIYTVCWTHSHNTMSN